MATISNLALQIRHTDDASLHKVIVSFNLSFVPAEYGKKFRYRIRLSGRDAGEVSTPSPSAAYEFNFGDSIYRTIAGGQIVQNLYSHTAEVPREFLDEDRDVTLNAPPPGPQVHLVFPDEIVASVTLERGPFRQFVILADRKTSPVKTFTA